MDSLGLQLMFACGVGLSIAVISWLCRVLCSVKLRGWELALLAGSVVGYFFGNELISSARGAAIVVLSYFMIRVFATSIYELLLVREDDLMSVDGEQQQMHRQGSAGIEANEATLELHRLKNFVDSLREYKVYVDDELVGSIGAGEERRIAIPSGSHEVWLGLDWGTSRRLAIHAQHGAVIRAKCGSSLTGARILLFPLYMSLWRDKYMWVQLERDAMRVLP